MEIPGRAMGREQYRREGGESIAMCETIDSKRAVPPYTVNGRKQRSADCADFTDLTDEMGLLGSCVDSTM
jgi:hypothetical protein